MLLKGRELITHSTELLSNEYPDLIDPMPEPLSRQQGGRHPRRGPFSLLKPPRVRRNLRLSYWHTRLFEQAQHVEIHKFLMASQIDSYNLESDEMLPMTLRPGGHTCLEKGRARGLTIHPGSWHIEYGRGAVVTTLPFARWTGCFLSLELESVQLVDGRVHQARHQAVSPRRRSRSVNRGRGRLDGHTLM